jgi:hypothetical protein
MLMREHAAATTVDAHQAERRWAAIDLVAASACLALSTFCFAAACVEFIALLTVRAVHPDAILLPFAFGIPPAVAGAFFLLARLAMRRQTESRWMVQWGAVGAPLVFALFVWLSV